MNPRRYLELSEISNAVLTGERIQRGEKTPYPASAWRVWLPPMTQSEREYCKEWGMQQLLHESFQLSTAVLSICMGDNANV